MSLGTLDQLDEAHKELADLRKSLGRVMSERDAYKAECEAWQEYNEACYFGEASEEWKAVESARARTDALLPPLPGPDYSDC